MDTFPIIQSQKFVGKTVRFPYKEKIETMDTFTLIQGQKKEKDSNYGHIPYNPRPKLCSNNGYISI